MKYPKRLIVKSTRNSRRKSLKDRILDRMRDEGIEVLYGNGAYELCRTYAGRHQRSCGAWAWFIRLREVVAGHPCGDFVGSCAPASACVKRGSRIHRSFVGACWEIDPPEDCNGR